MDVQVVFDTVLIHRGKYVLASFGQQAVRSCRILCEDADDSIDGITVASDSAFDPVAGVGIALDDTDSIIVPNSGRESSRISHEGNHPVSAFDSLFNDWLTGSSGRTEHCDSHTQDSISEDIYLQLRSFEV